MPLVPQQALLHAKGLTIELAFRDLETQMDEMPDVRIVSVSVLNPFADLTNHFIKIPGVGYQIVAVVETV